MWPIALSIVLFMGVYTWVNIEYRKEEAAFEPFQAMMDRKNAIVEKNFYDWYSIKTKRAETKYLIGPRANITSRAYENVLDEVVPEQLKYYMAGRPVLVPGFVKTEAPAGLAPGKPMPLRFYVPANLADSDLLNILTFYKEGKLFILATIFVKEKKDVDPAWLEGEPTPVTFEMPTDPIAAEIIEVSFLSEDRLAQWQITNLDPNAAVVEDEDDSESVEQKAK